MFPGHFFFYWYISSPRLEASWLERNKPTDDAVIKSQLEFYKDHGSEALNKMIIPDVD